MTSPSKSALYVYNAENRLVRATVQSGNNVSVEEYKYDYAGNRIAKSSEGEYTKYLLDVNGELTYVLAEMNYDGTEKCFYTRGDELISQERDGKKSYYVHDGHGSVRALADESGKVTDKYVYDAFGNLISSIGGTKNDFLFAGEQFDPVTGLYYLRARYMNPTVGTFISMDSYEGSIDDPVSLHKYLYANANPVNNSDPSGYMTFVGAIVASAICGILVSMATTYLSNVFAIRDQTGEFDWSWNLTVDDVCMSVLVGGGLGALGAIALMCQFVVATSILIASAAGFGIYSLYECVENANAGNISTAIFQGTLALISVFSVYGMGKTMSGWHSAPTTANGAEGSTFSDKKYSQHFEDQMTSDEAVRYRKYWGQDYSEQRSTPNTRCRQQVSPGTKSIMDYKIGTTNDGYYGYYRETIYDHFGRKIATVDYTVHNLPKDHTNPHYHRNSPLHPEQHGHVEHGDYPYR